MDRRFAVSENEALMLPNHFSLPVECESYIQAKEEFSKCENHMVCTCENLKAPRGCKCPLGSIRNERKEITNVLPIKTPFTEIRLEEGNINAYTHQHETTIVLESSLMFNSAHYIIEQSCDVTFEEIKGCYNCLERAQVKVSCITRINAWATVQCESQVFSIECGPSNKTNVVYLGFSNALIQQKCHTSCNGHEITFDLQGTLVYHPRSKRSQVYSEENSEENASEYFGNFDLPDLQPLLKVLNEHWKLALATLGTMAITIGITYVQPIV
ncbi:hypothetical protein RB195_018159 [Necator americanus]|uniref:Phlebovirus glycoprotein G2 C-terminal domain-containing protein n=1 Tax=Necator americanus TaxID=51031 RepID=A0ABR1CA16_NECAM